MLRRSFRDAIPGAAAWGLAAVAFLSAAAGPAWAGAWPRDAGRWFLSSGLSVSAPAGPGLGASAETDIYAEGGLGNGWLVMAQSLRGTDGGEVLLGFGHAVARPDGGAIGWTLAAGRRLQAGGRAVTYLRPGLAWGRGFSAGDRIGFLRLPSGGWISAEIQAELWARPRAIAPKLDLTLGLTASRRWTFLLELRASAYPGERRDLRLAPAVLLRLGRVQLKLQPDLPLGGGGRPGISLALWSEF
ncbi:hypothetical protein U879_19215 [Defluviimonas sp. 20V17]|uniref:Cellulose biosynthesis protein BcsS n=1 Tax=Allgaiera indica TaxID=765699 RepID=A0AAN4USA6_9RHOB|nr:hypothetical protein [Allgaiera indica]KDB02095.1 hypothetical protein U879_19215 [Defluviimonas sp. 20V17]GHE03118.1 hypothetical protein GCM10008024_25220 [Allgaiera indica]SDX11102.1 hypothetical protein SAMN05444006_11041 [Allgaiera indica]